MDCNPVQGFCSITTYGVCVYLVFPFVFIFQHISTYFIDISVIPGSTDRKLSSLCWRLFTRLEKALRRVYFRICGQGCCARSRFSAHELEMELCNEYACGHVQCGTAATSTRVSLSARISTRSRGPTELDDCRTPEGGKAVCSIGSFGSVLLLCSVCPAPLQ